MITLARVCYVPSCVEEEGLINTSGGWMCPEHYHRKVAVGISADAYYAETPEERERIFANAEAYLDKYLPSRQKVK